MRANTRQFNLFLALMALAMLCGCQTNKKDKEVSTLRVYIEANSNDPATSQKVSLPPRGDPVLITIEKEPILTQANLIQARVTDAHGGIALQIQFDESSALVLEQYTAGNPGKHYVIAGQWGEKLVNGRWLAAPLITHRIADGILSFTTDMSREEADRLALGLNNVAKKIHKGHLK
jgi:preprotein translocase subunit SecD